MFYNSSKIIGRSTELVGVLFKELRLKLIIGSTILLAIVASATLTGVAQAQNENDLPAVGFSSANYEVNEGDGRVAVTLGISNVSRLLTGANLTVNYTTLDGDARLSAGDYSIASGTVTLSAGMTEATIYVDITDDSEFENDETFLVILVKGEGEYDISRGQTTVTINANDVPQVALDLYSRELLELERDRFSEIEIIYGRKFFASTGFNVRILTGPAKETLVVGLAARAATINDGGSAADVTFRGYHGHSTKPIPITSVTIFEGQNSSSENQMFDFLPNEVAVVDDDVVEFDETVNIYIATVNGFPITHDGLDITIRSSDSTEATLTVEDEREGGTTMATIDLGGKTLSDAIPSDALRLVLADGSTMNADVEIVATDIVAGLKKASTVNVPIRLKDDDLVEGTETVVVELRIDSTMAPRLEDLLTVGTASFTIADDPVTISLDVPDEVFEGDGARYLTARLSRPLAYPVTVFWTLTLPVKPGERMITISA